MQFHYTIDEAKAAYLCKGVSSPDNTLSCDSDACNGNTEYCIRLYSRQREGLTQFCFLREDEIWAHISKSERAYLHAKLSSIDPVTLDFIDDCDPEQQRVHNIAVPLCLDFDLKEPRMLDLSEKEREEKLDRHRRALKVSCMACCHTLWMQQQTVDDTTQISEMASRSPFLDDRDVKVCISDASGPDSGTYKVSSHVVIRTAKSCWSSLSSSKSLAILLNQTLTKALKLGVGGEEGQLHLVSKDPLEQMLMKATVAMLPFGAFPSKAQCTLNEVVEAFDIQIYNSRSLRMMGSYPRSKTSSNSRQLRPLARGYPQKKLAPPFDIRTVREHDPWYVSQEEKTGPRFHFELASDEAGKRHYGLKRTRDGIPVNLLHLTTPELNHCISNILTHCISFILGSGDVAEAKRIVDCVILPVTKIKRGYDLSGRFTHFQYEFKSKFCPWRHLRTKTKESTHSSRTLMLELFPEETAVAPFIKEYREAPYCKLVCFSKNCALYCCKQVESLRQLQPSLPFSCNNSSAQACFRVKLEKRFAREAALRLLGGIL